MYLLYVADIVIIPAGENIEELTTKLQTVLKTWRIKGNQVRTHH